MKKLWFVLLALFVTEFAFSQKEVNYLINNKELEYGFYLGPELRVARMIKGYQLYSGLKGAMILNDKYAFGLSGGGFITETVFRGMDDMGESALLNTVMAYGGLYFNYFVPSNIPVQISFPNLVGVAGVVLFVSNHADPERVDEEMVEGGVFFIYVPSVNLEVNITSYLRIGFGAGYRLAIKGDMDRISRKDLSDFT